MGKFSFGTGPAAVRWGEISILKFYAGLFLKVPLYYIIWLRLSDTGIIPGTNNWLSGPGITPFVPSNQLVLVTSLPTGPSVQTKDPRGPKNFSEPDLQYYMPQHYIFKDFTLSAEEFETLKRALDAYSKIPATAKDAQNLETMFSKLHEVEHLNKTVE